VDRGYGLARVVFADLRNPEVLRALRLCKNKARKIRENRGGFSTTYNLANSRGCCVFHYNNCASRARTTQALRSQNSSTRFCVCGEKRASEHRTAETSLSSGLAIEQRGRWRPAYRISRGSVGTAVRRGVFAALLSAENLGNGLGDRNRTGMRRCPGLATGTRSALEIPTRTNTPFSVYATSCRLQNSLCDVSAGGESTSKRNKP
jgi:hypothetical protein